MCVSIISAGVHGIAHAASSLLSDAAPIDKVLCSMPVATALLLSVEHEHHHCPLWSGYVHA
jgi:hypothetical protein